MFFVVIISDSNNNTHDDIYSAAVYTTKPYARVHFGSSGRKSVSARLPPTHQAKLQTWPLSLLVICHRPDMIVCDCAVVLLHVFVCSVWSGDSDWWHSWRWHAELHERREIGSWQDSVVLSSSGHQRMVARTRWLHYCQLPICLLHL